MATDLFLFPSPFTSSMTSLFHGVARSERAQGQGAIVLVPAQLTPFCLVTAVTDWHPRLESNPVVNNVVAELKI